MNNQRTERTVSGSGSGSGSALSGSTRPVIALYWIDDSAPKIKWLKKKKTSSELIALSLSLSLHQMDVFQIPLTAKLASPTQMWFSWSTAGRAADGTLVGNLCRLRHF